MICVELCPCFCNRKQGRPLFIVVCTLPFLSLAWAGMPSRAQPIMDLEYRVLTTNAKHALNFRLTFHL